MKIAIVDKSKYLKNNINKEIKKFNLKIDNKNPDIVISHGGDGTFFIAERKYPGIPKLLVRDSKVCHLCSPTSREELFKKLKNKKYSKINCMKLQTRNLLAVNDIIIRNKDLTEALRFKIKINSQPYSEELIGDGLVIATQFGSTGYFNSITRTSFKKEKIGIAFNNVKNRKKPIILNNNSKIEVKIIRGIAQLSADNNKKIIILKPNNKVLIKKAKAKTILLKL